MPVTAPPRNAALSAGGMPPRPASATRAFARTETFMPMKPAAAEASAADQEADGDLDVLQRDEDDEQDDADDGDRQVLPAKVGVRALLDGAGDVQHALVARRQASRLRVVTTP